MRVLLADDEQDDLESQALALRTRGFEVTTVDNGREAVDRTSSQEFEVIVLDLCMPILGGVDALREIRKRDPITPVLILSGHGDLEEVNRALHAGAFDILVKPCPVEALISAITDAAEHRSILLDVERTSTAPPGKR